MENNQIELGKIDEAYFGLVRGMLALVLTFKGKSWGSGTTILDLNEISDTLKIAKVDRVSKLTGIPVECSFHASMLKSWRVLDEVI